MKQKIFILLYVWYLITVLIWLFLASSAVVLMYRIKTWNNLIRKWKEETE